MMRLAELFKDILPVNIPAEFEGGEIVDVCVDSRQVKPGSLFVALAGPKTHGAKFINEAQARGASVVILDGPFSDREKQPHVFFVPVDNVRQVLPRLLNRFFHEPASKVKVVGITGTNGKTTITYLLESIFKVCGKRSGIVGTIQHRFGDKVVVAKNTTPGICDNYQLLSEMGAEGVDSCFMEVSSHALDQGRVDGIGFSGAIFTNLTGDHLDYHRTMEEYFLAKARLFTGLADEALAVINGDDLYGPRLVEMARSRVVTYGIHSPADFTAENIQMSFQGTRFLVKTPDGEIAITTPMVGQHNIYNILAAVAFCSAQNVPVTKLLEGIRLFAGAPGRLERVDCGQPFYVFVDYAHTEDALKNVLESLRDVSPAKIIVVFGCGGDRDQTKRPKMGRVASQLADFSILTNDNPRSEAPDEILRQIVAGFENNKYQVVPDRRTALEKALSLAKPGDIVLVAGKGHEDYQIFKDEVVEFKERDIIRDLLRKKI